MDDPGGVKRGFAIGAACGLLVVAWLWLSRPEDVGLSSSGFDAGGLVGGLASGSRPGLFDARRPTVRPLIGRDGGPARVENAVAASGASTAAAPPDGAAELTSLGAPSDPAGLQRLGTQKGLLSRLVAAAAAHPAALRALLNNKLLVDAYFSRDLVSRNCASGAALKSYLMNGSDPQGVSEEVSLVRGYLGDPAAASSAVGAAAGTEFAQRLASCPSVRQLAADPGAGLQIAAANPALLGLVADPAAAAALSSNAQASAALAGVKAALSAPQTP
ncbi:MAG: hypothetical protein HKL90_05280 [Elusimicrobia bacterium]|nr:hypothetical protein [Elusimicrobiota bacterium]